MIGKIIFVILSVLVLILVYFLTTGSLKKLKTDILSSYPFDLFFPHESNWSVGYFLIVIIFLGVLIYLMIKGNFALSPA